MMLVLLSTFALATGELICGNTFNGDCFDPDFLCNQDINKLSDKWAMIFSYFCNDEIPDLTSFCESDLSKLPDELHELIDRTCNNKEFCNLDPEELPPFQRFIYDKYCPPPNDNPPDEIPEFSTITAGIALVVAMGFTFYKRKSKL